MNNGITGIGLRMMPEIVMDRVKVLDLSMFLCKGCLDYNFIGIKGIHYLTKSGLPLLEKLGLRTHNQ